MDYFTQGVQVGNLFWVWGVEMYHSQYTQILSNPNPKTFIYYWKRNKWKKGPPFVPETRGPRATTAINATAVMTVFDAFSTNAELHDPMTTYVYDFKLERWTKYPNLKPIQDVKVLSLQIKEFFLNLNLSSIIFSGM